MGNYNKDKNNLKHAQSNARRDKKTTNEDMYRRIVTIKGQMGILTFPLPEERKAFDLASHATDWALVCWDIDEQLRNWLKYGYEFKTVEEAIQGARDRLNLVMDKYGLLFDAID